MVPDEIFELCQYVINDQDLAEEEETERVEALLRSTSFSLKGEALENAALDVLWRLRQSRSGSSGLSQTYTNTQMPKFRGGRNKYCWYQHSGPQHTVNASTKRGFGRNGICEMDCLPTTLQKPTDCVQLQSHSNTVAPTLENFEDTWDGIVDWLIDEDDGGANATSDTSSSTDPLRDSSSRPYESLQVIPPLSDYHSFIQLEGSIRFNDCDHRVDCSYNSLSTDQHDEESFPPKSKNSAMLSHPSPVLSSCGFGDESRWLECARDTLLDSIYTSWYHTTISRDADSKLCLLQQWLYQAWIREHDLSTAPAPAPNSPDGIASASPRTRRCTKTRRSALTAQEAKRRANDMRQRNDQHPAIWVC